MTARNRRPAYALLVPAESVEPSSVPLCHDGGAPASRVPAVVGEVRTGLGRHVGELVTVPVSAPRERTATLRAALELPVRRAAGVIGLGALPLELQYAGRWLAGRLPTGTVLAAGHAYGAAVARHNVLEALERTGLGTAATVLVAGAPGSLGGLTARLLAREGVPVTLASPRRGGVCRALEPPGTGTPGRPVSLRDADVVLVLTAAAARQVSAGRVRSDSLVIDGTGALADCAPLPSAHRVRVVRGGLVHIPGYRTTCRLGTGPSTATWGCLAETYLLSLQAHREHVVAVPTVEDALRVERLAAADGVTPRSLELATPSAAGRSSAP